MATPEGAIEVINTRFGRHPAHRALHAKGILCAGTFTATPAAVALTAAPHMQGDPVTAVARFSNAAGDPGIPDFAPDVRGLAVKIDLPGGEGRTDIVAQTVSHFPTKTPDGFLELLRASAPGPAAAWRLPLFLARHPAAARTLPADLAAMRPLDSFATTSYYALHAFGWRAAGGDVRHVRYRFVPEEGDRRIGLREARRRGRDYLQDDVRDRLARGPIRFTLELTIARAGDPVDDASARWRGERETVDAGTLELTGLDTTREQDGDVLVFDPTRVPDGIELTDDPVLRFRPRAYSVSVERRTAG